MTPDEIERIRALADRLEAHTEQMANTSWGLTMQEWNVISNDILLAARTLRALDEAQARAQRAEERLAWKPITKALESGGPYLVTNNLKATLNDGSMSHVFLTRMIHQNGDEFSAYTDELRKVHNLSHFLPVARAAQTLKDRNDV